MAQLQTLSTGDRELIVLLRGSEAMTVGDLVESTGVTATAIRQRLVRLMGLGLIDRSEEREGRGRPSHRYRLTESGLRDTAANNLGDLALVLWQEVQQIEDEQLRHRVVSGAVQRLAEKYEADIRGAGAGNGATPAERMEAIVRIFAERQIPVTYEKNDGLPVIKVSGCPFPGLTDEHREICDMEQELIGRIVGSPIELCKCQKDGDRCCSFEVAMKNA